MIRLRRINKHEIDWDKHAGCIQLADGGWAVLEEGTRQPTRNRGENYQFPIHWQPIDITEAE